MSQRDAFESVYKTHFRPVLAYALRRARGPEDAADVVAETFLVAWRRFDQIPEERAQAWLIGVARMVLANQQRGEVRRNRLASRLGEVLAANPSVPEPPAGTEDLQQAWRLLSPRDQEILALSAWEGLNALEIATVLDIPAATARTRLSRARRRFRQTLNHDLVGHCRSESEARR